MRILFLFSLVRIFNTILILHCILKILSLSCLLLLYAMDITTLITVLNYYITFVTERAALSSLFEMKARIT